MSEDPEKIRKLADYAKRIKKAANPLSLSSPPTVCDGGEERDRSTPDPTAGE
jgi:hypothetical protein